MDIGSVRTIWVIEPIVTPGEIPSLAAQQPVAPPEAWEPVGEPAGV